jgi:hypothetical protein
MTTRRGFFGSLLGAASLIGLDTSKGEDRTAFNFTCACGNGLCAEVPKEVGEKLSLDCECGLKWDLEWTGENFKTRMHNPDRENEAVPSINVQTPEALADFIAKRNAGVFGARNEAEHQEILAQMSKDFDEEED